MNDFVNNHQHGGYDVTCHQRIHLYCYICVRYMDTHIQTENGQFAYQTLNDNNSSLTTDSFVQD
jgi:hypothetical protein